jgi:hypothetical protein
MKRGRSTSSPTIAHQRRFDAIKDAGCVVAWLRGLGWTPADVHHLTLGGKHGQRRMGHEYTVGLNPWSHRGVAFNGLTVEECRDMFGPSYVLEPRAFREIYPDDVLMAAQASMLERAA